MLILQNNKIQFPNEEISYHYEYNYMNNEFKLIKGAYPTENILNLDNYSNQIEFEYGDQVITENAIFIIGNKRIKMIGYQPKEITIAYLDEDNNIIKKQSIYK